MLQLLVFINGKVFLSRLLNKTNIKAINDFLFLFNPMIKHHMLQWSHLLVFSR